VSVFSDRPGLGASGREGSRSSSTQASDEITSAGNGGAGRPSMPSVNGELGFLPEARTMEVSVRSTDFAGAPVVPQAVDRAVLLRMDGVQAGQIIGVEALPFTIGRHPTNQLRVDEDSISRHHARIVKQGDEYLVEDLGSRNGVFVAGKRVTRARLEHDSWLQFGPRVSSAFR
jgi:hypothetical protein